MQHVWEKHKDCDRTACYICEGGLSVCTVCGLAEGALTTDCPGYRCYAEKGDAIYKGDVDFVDGNWVNQSSPHSPASYNK